MRAANVWTETGFVFTTDGHPCDPRNALRALTAAATKAGLANVGLGRRRPLGGGPALGRSCG